MLIYLFTHSLDIPKYIFIYICVCVCVCVSVSVSVSGARGTVLIFQVHPLQGDQAAGSVVLDTGQGDTQRVKVKCALSPPPRSLKVARRQKMQTRQEGQVRALLTIRFLGESVGWAEVLRAVLPTKRILFFVTETFASASTGLVSLVVEQIMYRLHVLNVRPNGQLIDYWESKLATEILPIRDEAKVDKV